MVGSGKKGNNGIIKVYAGGFFDLSQVNNQSNPVLQWFAKLVQEDYVTAEALYASTFIFVLVIASQELLRMQMYGMDHYVPFARGDGGGGSGALW
mmetsp:Transcript_32800/g.48591  ORF Transcript_32800/g.48591 Transcript_32800/m.48591 type:complete len:95 (+) Transcript_32800:30-314(+)